MKISEIFKSIQGEGQQAGEVTTFIRTIGCNLRCTWCDTAYAYKEGKEMSIEKIIKKVDDLEVNNICITGGEPLLQSEMIELVRALLFKHYDIFIETNGSIKIWGNNPKLHFIFDYKLPSSGNKDYKFISSNLDDPCAYEVKFVIANEEDYKIAKAFINGYRGQVKILFSPCFSKRWNKKLAKMIIKDNLPVKYSLQIHKVLWSPTKRGV
jgi:7-carboxy-7-deazaguanine synthase